MFYFHRFISGISNIFFLKCSQDVPSNYCNYLFIFILFSALFLSLTKFYYIFLNWILHRRHHRLENFRAGLFQQYNDLKSRYGAKNVEIAIENSLFEIERKIIRNHEWIKMVKEIDFLYDQATKRLLEPVEELDDLNEMMEYKLRKIDALVNILECSLRGTSPNLRTVSFE